VAHSLSLARVAGICFTGPMGLMTASKGYRRGYGQWVPPFRLKAEATDLYSFFVASAFRRKNKQNRGRTGNRPSFSRVKFVIYRPQARLEHVCVNLRRREVGVAEHQLDHPKVCTPFQ
jgi:hypothetical protein